MTRVIASITFAILLAVSVTSAGCASANGPSGDTALASVGESVTVGPLEFRLDATFTSGPGSERNERLDISAKFVNTSEATVTLYPETPDVSLEGDAGDIAAVGGDGESEGWSMTPGSYSVPTTAALAPGGYFVMRRAFVVDRNDDRLRATVDAQDNGGVTWRLR